MADRAGTPIPQPEGQPFLRLTRKVDAEQVFTVEPGIYFIPSLLKELREGHAGKQVNWKRVDDFLPFGGVRIEDNVRVTEGGHENMTRDAFRHEKR
jgi:Xaa-Pro dipeptidase